MGIKRVIMISFRNSLIREGLSRIAPEKDPVNLVKKHMNVPILQCREDPLQDLFINGSKAVN